MTSTNKQENLTTPAFVLSILGGIFAIFTFALALWASHECFANHDSIVQNIIDNLMAENPQYDWSEAQVIANLTWDFLAFVCIFTIAYSVYACVINWIGLQYVRRAQATAKYSLAVSILQIIALPFGTAVGILMIIARTKNNRLSATTTKVDKKPKRKA